MKQKIYFLSFLLSGIFMLSILTVKGQSDDDPNIDRIPDWFIDQQQNNRNPMPSTVVTIDGYDNYYLGVDFAEGHISEDPTDNGKYFVAMNINDTHYTLDGHDWSDIYVTFPGYNVRGDVLTAYDADGNLYYEQMYGSSILGCVVVKSTDNGQTWGSPVVAIAGNDKNWMCADMTEGPYSNYIYTVMTNNGSGNFARSTNQGQSFQTTFSPGTQSLPGMMVCIGAWNNTDGGAVYVVTNSGSSFQSLYTFYQSLDGGATFTLKSQQQFANYVGTDVNGRNSVQNMRTRPYPFITADNSNGPHRGRLYLIYASNTPVGNGNKPDIFCRYSDNGGSSWSSPEVVNDDFPTTNNHQWHPATWCDYETGRLYVHWMDTRDTPTSDSALIYAAYSDDGGQTFSQNFPVSNKKMKINCTSCGGGGTPSYQGDYTSIVSNSVTSMSTWADFRNGNFGTYVAYFPDYAMGISPSNSQTTGNVATFTAEVPDVKAYDNDVIFSVDVETPSAGVFTVNFPNGNTLSTFPGTLSFEVISDGNVPVGFYDVTLTGTGPNGTPKHIRTATVQVAPMSPPSADFSADDVTPCAGSAVNFTDESTGFPSSWSWTFDGGDPATSSDQNPTGIVWNIPGTYDVTLVVANTAGDDTLSIQNYIEVLAIPAAPTAGDESACEGSTIPPLVATGTNINWYDDAALTNLVFSGNTFETGQTEAGEYTYYATQTDDCESTGTAATLTIYALPEVGLGAFDNVCVDAPAFELTGGTPEGGFYSGPGVDPDGNFDPATAGVGTHDINYSYTDLNGCSNDSTQQITVLDLPVVTFDPVGNVCVNGGTVTLSGGQPEGGTYAGPGVDNGIFDPSLAGIGEHVITYTYQDENGCDDMAETTVSVTDFPHPGLGADTTLCANESLTLDATVTGAVSYEWYPGGQTTAQITVDSAGIGIGSQMFVVSVTDGNDCIGMDTITVEFKDCTGIGELAGVENIRLYPNPGQGEFTLQIKTADPVDVNVKVYNNRGVTVFEEKGISVSNSRLVRMDLSAQPSGIYMVNVYNKDGQWVEKLIIRK